MTRWGTLLPEGYLLTFNYFYLLLPFCFYKKYFEIFSLLRKLQIFHSFTLAPSSQVLLDLAHTFILKKILNISFQIVTAIKDQIMQPVTTMATVLARLDLMVQSVASVMKATLDTQIVNVSF